MEIYDKHLQKLRLKQTNKKFKMTLQLHCKNMLIQIDENKRICYILFDISQRIFKNLNCMTWPDVTVQIYLGRISQN